MNENSRTLQTEDATERIVFDTLMRRRSTRAFDPSPVPSWKLQRLFQAAQWTPSSFNEQPWRYIVTSVEKPDAHEKLLTSLTGNNRAWAKDAPVLILAAASMSHTRTGETNRHAAYDLGQSVANLSTEATALGLVVHQMGGFSGERVRADFGLPEDVIPFAVLAVGGPGDPSALPERLRILESSPRTRKSLSETVSSGYWNTPFFSEGEPD